MLICAYGSPCLPSALSVCQATHIHFLGIVGLDSVVLLSVSFAAKIWLICET